MPKRPTPNSTRLLITAWLAGLMAIAGGPAQGAVIYDGGDNGTPAGGLLQGLVDEFGSVLQAFGSTIVTDEAFFVSSIGVYIESVDTDGPLQLVILPTTTYDYLDNLALPDPLESLTSSYSVHLGSVTPGLNSVSVDWFLPAGSWFIAAVPEIATLQASISGALNPSSVNAYFGHGGRWSPLEGGFDIPSFKLEGEAVPEPSAGMLVVLGAGCALLRRRRNT
jgi:hypothetical protein